MSASGSYNRIRPLSVAIDAVERGIATRAEDHGAGVGAAGAARAGVGAAGGGCQGAEGFAGGAGDRQNRARRVHYAAAWGVTVSQRIAPGTRRDEIARLKHY